MNLETGSGFYVEARDDATAGSGALMRVRGYLERCTSEGFPPGLSLALVDRDGVVFQVCGGHASLVPEPLSAGPETSYDLASLTKVVCTTTLALAARDRGLWGLGDPVTRWLPGYPVARTTLWHLLTHTSGLVEHRPFYASYRGRGEVEAAVYEEAAGSAPGGEVCYSDLNFMLLGWALEACFSKPLDEVFSAQVAGPLGMPATRFRPPASERRLVAATEMDGDQRPWAGLVWGEVHDGNAWALGGVAGHAGLFAPVGDLAHFVQSLLQAGTGAVLPASSVEEMGTLQAESDSDVRGLGWRLRPSGWGAWPEGTMWHTGFTGTSLLVDRPRGVAVILLSNAIHPRRRLDEQAAFRAEVHRLVADALS